ncbi:Gustatory and odorant receptor 22, partial [Folsomia candida]
QLKMCISSSPSTSSPDFITLSNGNLEILNSPNTNNYEILERLMDLFELVYESVENFNKFYAFALIVDMFIGLINALATVYQINRVTYESSRASWEDTVFVLIKIPMHCVYVLRLFYLINLGETMTTEGLGVLRSLQRTNTASILSGGAGGGVLLAKIQMLVTRVSLNPPSVSPGNYFRLSRRLLASVVSLLATYFIVLTELREEDEGRSLIRSLLKNSCVNNSNK